MPDTWPVGLPQRFQADDYNEEEADLLLETPEVAVPKSRPLWTAAARPITGSIDIELSALDALRAFGRVTLLGWSLPFKFPAQTGDGDAEFPGYWLVKFRKDGLPKVSPISGMGGQLVKVSLGLFKLP